MQPRFNVSILNCGNRGLDIIRHFEGERLKPYICPAGKPTIGYGHVILPGEDFSKGITKSQAEALLRKDVRRFESAVRKLVKVPLTQSMFDALVSFAFNVGAANLEKSTLMKRVNENAFVEASREFLRWNKATVGGKKVVLDGLTKRREAESKLFLD